VVSEDAAEGQALRFKAGLGPMDGERAHCAGGGGAAGRDAARRRQLRRRGAPAAWAWAVETSSA
jgi:hypothetical protein